MESENTRKVFVLGNGKNYLTMHPVHTKNESGDPGSLFWKSAIYDQHLNIISWFGQGYGDKFDHEPTEEEICQCIVQQFHLPAMTGAMSSERFDEWTSQLPHG